MGRGSGHSVSVYYDLIFLLFFLLMCPIDKTSCQLVINNERICHMIRRGREVYRCCLREITLNCNVALVLEVHLLLMRLALLLVRFALLLVRFALLLVRFIRCCL